MADTVVVEPAVGVKVVVCFVDELVVVILPVVLSIVAVVVPDVEEVVV